MTKAVQVSLGLMMMGQLGWIGTSDGKLGHECNLRPNGLRSLRVL